jgi:hypothetical protein
MRRIGLALACALVLSACGGEDSPGDREQIETVIETYFTAFSAGDGAKACGQLSTDAQVKLVEATRASNCPDAMDAAAKQPGIEPYVEQLGEVEVLEVDVSGAEASAKVRAIDQETTIPLAKEDGEWKIQGGQVAPG